MKHSVQLTLLSVVLLLLCLGARAGSITEEEAQAKAWSFLQSQRPSSAARRLSPARTPAELNRSDTGESSLYVFNVGEQDGFVIVSGDDRTRSILGYADRGSFDADKAPAALREMLSIYARQIEQVRLTQDSVRVMSRSPRRISGTMADVEPLLSTTWNQAAPYNAYCPTLGDQTALTGCVATAMAQIANYYEYPTESVPSLAAYTTSTNKINVSAWGTTTFDWGNMLDNYDGGYTSAQQAAVATLMRYCGQAAQMDYGFTSGAYNGDALYAFKEKLGYNANADFRSAANYSADGWEDLIYKEVSASRPVYYSALNGEEGCDVSGHAFVIDGYRTDGNYFHVNWGWGGACNGYFNLFALDPGAPESTATATGWHYQMLAIVGLSPEEVSTTTLSKDASGSYLITSTDDWNELSANLNAYTGESFKLTSDISITTMVGTEGMPFSGTFDGQGHTLTVDIEGGDYYIAPFSSVNGTTAIKNLKVQGVVSSSYYHASGFIGSSMDIVTITNCEVAVTVNGSEYSGGFIGHAHYSQPTFIDCIFSGSINGSHDHGCFVGWKEHGSRPVYINCLSMPASFECGTSCDFSHPGHGGSADHATITNSYYYFDGEFSLAQGTAITAEQLAGGFAAHALQGGSRDWTTGLVWGQQIGTDATPVLTDNSAKAVHKVVFVRDGVTLLNVYANETFGDRMPTAEALGMSNVTFTHNGAAFTSATKVTADIEVTCTGSSLYAVNFESMEHGTVSMEGFVPNSTITFIANPAENYVLNTLTVTDSEGNELPLTPTADINVFTMPWPASGITVTATFIQFVKDSDGYYVIDSEIAWRTLGNFVKSGVGTLNAKLTKDINVTTMIGSESHPYTGTFDGQGHTLTVNIETNLERTGPFHYASNSTFKNLTIAGTINTSNHGVGGLIGWAKNVVIQNCESRVTINSSYHGDGTLSGFICLVRDGSAHLYDCVFNGHVYGPNVDCCGGLCGWQDGGAYFYNCLNIGTFEIGSNYNCATFCRNGASTYNCYYISSLAEPLQELQGTAITAEQLANGFAAHALQNGSRDWTTGQVWGQQIGTDDTPVLTNDATKHVYRADLQMNGEHVLYIYTNSPMGSQMPTAAQLGLKSATFTCDGKALTPETTFGADPVIEVTGTSAITLTIAETEHGTFTVTPSTFVAGTLATITTTPDEGYGIMSVTVTDEDGNEVEVAATDNHNVYTFVWPAKSVTVKATFSTPITLAINVTEMGTLRTLIDEAAKEKSSNAYFVESITVSGSVNNDDLRTLATMCTGFYTLSNIDLSEANVDGNRIEYWIFEGKEKLASIKLPETLEYIYDGAFYDCDALTSIDIPASVKRIWSNAFTDCSNLATVTGMEGLSADDHYNSWDVFYGTAITQPVYGGTVFLYMPPSITGEYEVPVGIKMTAAGSMRNSQLTTVILPASLTDIGDDTFQECPNMTDIYCYATVPPTSHSGVWDWGFDRSACTIHVPASAVEDYKNAYDWQEFERIVGITIGDLVDMTINVPMAGTLNDELFDTAVAAAKISDKALVKSLTVTGSIDASDVEYLNTLPNTLYNLVTLNMSEAILEGNAIAERMFAATLYRSIQLPATVSSIAAEAFRGSRRLRNITIPSAVSTIENNTFRGCTALEAVTFAEGSVLKRIEEEAFRDLSSLTSISLPASLEYIGAYAFAGSGLTSITIPDNVTEMGHRGLQNCGSLTSITLGSGLTYIPDCWAENCHNLEEVTIGKRVTNISWLVFYGRNIKNVYCYAKNAPSWYNSFYDGINPEAVLHVYENCVSRYQNANGWNGFANIVGDLGSYPTVEIAVNVETPGALSEALATAMADKGCEDFFDITALTVMGDINNADLEYIRDNMGASLDKLDLGAAKVENNEMRDYALRYCGFEEIVLPSTIERIGGWYALTHCDNLKTLHIPSSVTYIGGDFGRWNQSLETVTGGENIRWLYAGMYFANTPNLKTPVIFNQYFVRLPESTEGAYEVPESVTTILRDAMYYASKLTSLTLPESVTTICGYVFGEDVNLRDIYYRAVEVPNTADDAFGDFNPSACTLHVYAEMAEVFQAHELWSQFNIVGDLGNIPNSEPIAESDYADLCAIASTLGGDSWSRKWLTNKNVQTASRWRGVTFDEEGYVTDINLEDNKLCGDISALAFNGMTRLKSLNLNSNAITGDLHTLIGSLPTDCRLSVIGQDFGYQGEHTLYELCNYGGLPNIAYYNTDSKTFVSTLMGVSGVCQFYHEGSNDDDYWEGYIFSDGYTESYPKFYWSSPATMECLYPHRFTFTYHYEMGDANMDDELNVLDLQSTLNYSNGDTGQLFNISAANTYDADDEINVQDIVATVNILLALDDDSESRPANARLQGNAGVQQAAEACVSVENGQIVLYTTKPVAALDLRLTGISPEQLCWNTEAMGFATSSAEYRDGTHTIIYSLTPRQMEEGRTVLATFGQQLCPQLASVVLSDANARSIMVDTGAATGISTSAYANGEKSCYTLDGVRQNPAAGKLRKGIYVINGKKTVIK